MSNRPLGSLGLLVLSVACLAACASDPPAEPVAVGTTLSPATLEDPHGEPHAIDTEVRILLFSRDMDGGGLIRELLAEDAGLLARERAVYVADISGMPTLIANMMAIPSMRERPYPTLLDRDGTVTAGWPAREGQATVVRLDALRVLEIDYAGSLPELRTELAGAAGP